MKKYLLILICLLFVINVFAQDKNANWELKVVNYYSDGLITSSHSNIFVYSSNFDSINEINLRKHKYYWEKIEDSLYIERQKRGDKNKLYKQVAVAFWVKPLRNILSNDTFNVEISKKKYDPSKYGDTVRGEFDKYNFFHETILKVSEHITTKQVLKRKSENGFYLIGKYDILQNTSIHLGFQSSDTNLDYIANTNSNYENYNPHIISILPNRYNYFSYDYQIINNEDTNHFKEFNSFPNFSWSQSEYKMKIDSTYCLRKLITDTIDGKVNYGIHKNYLERPEELICDSKNNSFIFLMSKLRENDYYQYKLVPWLDYEGKDIPWKDGYINQCYFEIKNVPVGKYILYIKNKKYGLISDGYKITILPLWYQTIAFKIISCSLLFLSFLATGFWFYKRKQKRKLLALEKQKSQIDIQLKTVRSQLNPHFIFNALSSIQSLISKTDYEKANEYLIDFSQLLRKPLNQENIATWNLNDEIELLKTYIKLEQLRTSFLFDFKIDESINIHTISFPAMLLQPIVENAIKHGFSASQQGQLSITINKENRTIIITIEDNGNTFNINQIKEGNGLALTKDYIELVNKQYPHSFVSMNFDTTNEATNCIFTFKNWIDE